MLQNKFIKIIKLIYCQLIQVNPIRLKKMLNLIQIPSFYHFRAQFYYYLLTFK